jgi:hypothetical protein
MRLIRQESVIYGASCTKNAESGIYGKLTDAPRTRCPARVADGAGLSVALAPPGAHSPSTYLVVSPLLPSDPTKFCLERFDIPKNVNVFGFRWMIS